MSARFYANLRVVIACVLTLAYAGLYVASLARASNPFFQVATVLGVITFLFCGTLAFRQAKRGPSNALDGAFFNCLIVVCVVMPLSVLMYPYCKHLQYAATQVLFIVRMNDIGLAMHAYADDHDQRFPPPAIYSKNGKPLLSWRVALLPYLGHADLYQRFKLDEPWDSPNNLALVDRMPEVYAPPPYWDDREVPHTTCFRVYVGPGAAFEGPTGVSVGDFPDGTNNTLLIVDARPMDLVVSVNGPVPALRTRDKMTYMLFADGSVTPIRGDKLTDAELRGLITRNGGEEVSHLLR